MRTAFIPASWLNTRRIRAHGLLLAVCLWSAYALDMATPGLRDRNGLIKGADFLHFYTLGNLALHNRGDLLYNMPAQASLLQELVPEAAGNLYVPLYGPQVSLLFAPFARLPYGWALPAWLVLNLLMYASCCFAVWKYCPNLQGKGSMVLLLVIAFPGLFHLLTWGQTSGLALVCFTFAFLALRKARPFLAGLALGSLVYKPQLGLAAALVFLFVYEWKIIAGATLAALLQLGFGWWRFGTQVMHDYVRALLHINEVLPRLEPRPYQMFSLRGFWSLLLPWPNIAFGLYVLSALIVLVLAITCCKRQLSLSVRYSALLLATVLVAPHLTAYDLVILAPAFLLLGDWSAGHARDSAGPIINLFVYSCFPLFLWGPLARLTHLQLSVPLMAAFVWFAGRIASARHNCTPLSC